MSDTTACVVFVTSILTAGIVYVIVQHHRRQTAQGRAWQECRRRLPSWVRRTEILLVFLFALVVGPIMQVILDVMYLIANGGKHASGVALGLVMAASVLGGLILALLIGNWLAWLIPPIRRANHAVFAEVPATSYTGAFVGLYRLSAIVLAACIVLGALAVLHPWVR
jgi:hypothetical protein